MNTKRQTIWLVSMLSLMVVLSAYYLFTQDLDDTGKLSDSGEKTEDVSEVNGSGGLVVDQVDQGAGGISPQDKEVLDQLEKEGLIATGIFGQLQEKREAQYTKEHERIMEVIANVGETSDEELAAATEELNLLEEKSSKITDLEPALAEQYEMALISPENDRYKVVVTSDKLEKKDAAQIIEQVMKTLEVKPDQVSVQYVPAP